MKRKKRKKSIGGLLLILVILLAGVFSGTAIFRYLWPSEAGVSPESIDSPSALKEEKLEKRISILVIGADKRPKESSYNTDTLIVASVDPETKVISMLSILRDTRMRYRNSDVRINSLAMYAGLDGLAKEVEELTGIPLDGYVMTNFDGFKDIIDTLGGIDVYVEKDMYYETGDFDVDGVINLKQGQQTLSGWQALQYARFRNDALADVSRSARQQKVLKVAAKKMLEPATIPKLPKLVPQLMNAIETNISMSNMLSLSRVAMSFEEASIVMQTLPGYFLDLGGVSYWEVDRDAAKVVGKNMMLGIVTDKVLDSTVLGKLDAATRAKIAQDAQRQQTLASEPAATEEEKTLSTEETSEESEESSAEVWGTGESDAAFDETQDVEPGGDPGDDLEDDTWDDFQADDETEPPIQQMIASD